MVRLVPQADKPRDLLLNSDNFPVPPKRSGYWKIFSTDLAWAGIGAPPSGVGIQSEFPPPGQQSYGINSARDGRHAQITASGSSQSASMIEKCYPTGNIFGLRPCAWLNCRSDSFSRGEEPSWLNRWRCLSRADSTRS